MISMKKLEWDKLSVPQRLTLGQVTNRPKDISSWDLEEYYNAVTDDTCKLDAWHKEVTSFNYNKYGVNKKNTIECSLNSYKSILEKIKNFKIILKEAGNDLINWSDQKISLRFTKLGLKCKAYYISTYVSEYQEHLKKIGVKAVDPKVNTTKGKLEEIIKTDKATQDDYWRYYKQASSYEATTVLDKMDLEHLYLIIDSELKCVTKKLDRCCWRGRNSDFQKIAKLLCEKSVTKQDYKRITKWAGISNVSLDFYD